MPLILGSVSKSFKNPFLVIPCFEFLGKSKVMKEFTGMGFIPVQLTTCQKMINFGGSPFWTVLK